MRPSRTPHRRWGGRLDSRLVWRKRSRTRTPRPRLGARSAGKSEAGGDECKGSWMGPRSSWEVTPGTLAPASGGPGSEAKPELTQLLLRLFGPTAIRERTGRTGMQHRADRKGLASLESETRALGRERADTQHPGGLEHLHDALQGSVAGLRQSLAFAGRQLVRRSVAARVFQEGRAGTSSKRRNARRSFAARRSASAPSPTGAIHSLHCGCIRSRARDALGVRWRAFRRVPRCPSIPAPSARPQREHRSEPSRTGRGSCPTTEPRSAAARSASGIARSWAGRSRGGCRPE